MPIIFNQPQSPRLTELENFVREYDKIFIDTCSLLEPSSEKFFQYVVPILEREQKPMILPQSCCAELEKFANNLTLCRQKSPDDPNLNAKAIRACQNVNRLIKAKLIEIFGEPKDASHADKVFHAIFARIKCDYNVFFITQDSGLAYDSYDEFKDSRSVKGVKKIIVCKLDGNGLPQIFPADISEKNPRTSFNDAPKNPRPADSSLENIPLNERFNLTDKVTQIEGNLPVTHIPTEGDYVTAMRDGKTKRLRLTEKIGTGGEGLIYRTEFNGWVAKIYKRENLTRQRHEKLKLMLTKKIDCVGVCYPFALLKNDRDEFVGCLMREASGKELDKSVFKPALLQKYFPDWAKVDLVQLCVTILQKLKYLHDRNVILGDINPRNILVVSPTEVYFVDTDSYQVEGFACPVGMPLFTAPELQNNKKFGLRTLDNENFSVAMLLFEIMLPGKSPYPVRNGECFYNEFPYPLGENRSQNPPAGSWRYCWSHLMYKVKEAFYSTFHHNGDHSGEKNRFGVGHWLRLFENYLSWIQSGKMAEQDEESTKIFPTRFKNVTQKNLIACKLCGRKFNEEELEQGICNDCLKDGKKYYCENCGREMIYTNYQKFIKRAKRHRFCRDCFEKMTADFQRRNHKNRGDELNFEQSWAEIVDGALGKGTYEKFRNGQTLKAFSQRRDHVSFDDANATFAEFIMRNGNGSFTVSRSSPLTWDLPWNDPFDRW